VLRAIPARPPARAAKAAAQARLVERAATEGPGALGSADRLRLLGDAQALASLRARVQQPGAHPDWSVAHDNAGPARTAPADEDATHDESSVASAH
jgi:hypothetical protein